MCFTLHLNPSGARLLSAALACAFNAPRSYFGRVKPSAKAEMWAVSALISFFLHRCNQQFLCFSMHHYAARRRLERLRLCGTASQSSLSDARERSGRCLHAPPLWLRAKLKSPLCCVQRDFVWPTARQSIPSCKFGGRRPLPLLVHRRQRFVNTETMRPIRGCYSGAQNSI